MLELTKAPYFVNQINEEDLKGSWRCMEFTDPNILGREMRATTEQVDLNLSRKEFKMFYRPMQKTGNVWTPLTGGGLVLTQANEREYVYILDDNPEKPAGISVPSSEAMEVKYFNYEDEEVESSEALTNGVLNEGYYYTKTLKDGYSTSWGFIMSLIDVSQTATNGLMSVLAPLCDLFMVMSLDFSVLPNLRVNE